MPKYSKNSKSKLATCIKPIQHLMGEVVLGFDNTILDGLRDRETQTKAFRNNASKVQFPNSKHNGHPPKYDESSAVDVAPYPIPLGWGAINGTSKSEINLDWKERVKFYQLASVVFYEWKKLQLKNKEYRKYTLRWGGDWDRDGDYTDNKFDDLVHYELILNEEDSKGEDDD